MGDWAEQALPKGHPARHKKPSAYKPDPHVLRMAQNFVALASLTKLTDDPEKHAEALEKWFWERYNEQVAAALV